MPLAKWLIRMKTLYHAFFVLILLSSQVGGAAFAEEGGQDTPEALSNQEDTSNNNATEAAQTKTKTRPNPEAERIRALKAEYPDKELRKLNAQQGEFTALWRQDRSGKAFGALLIVPTDGQTANWPNTIDVIRTDLPKNGWSTLSIDIEPLSPPVVPARDTSATDISIESKTSLQTNIATKKADPNMGRIEAAIGFLHNQGQYNIIMIGYGQSAKRVLEYANDSEAAGMKKTIRAKQGKSTQRPIRAIVLLNPQQMEAQPIAPLIDSFSYKDMPILDLVIGTHYLDTLDAETRKQVAKDSGYSNYFQLKVLEPSTVVFGQENRLSRRIRGFLNKHAKGVEIDKR